MEISKKQFLIIIDSEKYVQDVLWYYNEFELFELN